MKKQKAISECFLTDSEGRRYCKDGKFREFALLGTERCCVKFWKRSAWAHKVGTRSGLDVYMVHYLREGESLDASGTIHSPNGDRHVDRCWKPSIDKNNKTLK